MSTHVFAGPTITAARILALVPDAVVHPPIGHGDALRLPLAAGDRVLIIDGLWHQSLPVRHKEILLLLADGVTVLGAASMGALRAAELAPYGMVGVGAVFRAYRDGLLDADDEVAVLQGPDGTALTCALVNLRCAFQRAAAAGRITSAEATALEAAARALPYTRRSWTALGRAAADAGLDDAFDRANAWRRSHPFDLKYQDADEALRLLAQGDDLSGTSAREWESEPWRTSFVRYWIAAHRPAATDTAVPLLALLQHQQLYDTDFPRRWRSRVLAAFAPQFGSTSATAVQADLSTRLGFAVTDLTSEQLRYWLTCDELVTAASDEQLVHLLVRTARLDDAWPIWPTNPAEAGGLLDPEVGSHRSVADALAVNAAAQAADPQHTIAHLDPARIAAHLTRQWRLPGDASAQALDAAARDRAFRSFTGAVECDRTFYLGALASTSSSSPANAGASDSVRI